MSLNWYVEFRVSVDKPLGFKQNAFTNQFRYDMFVWFSGYIQVREIVILKLFVATVVQPANIQH